MAGDAYAVLDALAGVADGPIAMAAAVVTESGFEEAYDLANEASRFEFGSVTKTMTAHVLATLVLDGVVGLDDEIGRWIDAGPNGGITLRALATHTSGLPRVAPNGDTHDGFDPRNPYAGYDAAMAEAALRTMTLDTEAGYSNFGYQLLGLALVRAAGQPFDELLQRHVFDACSMTSATLGPGPHQVVGYADGAPTPTWTDALPGHGGVCATLRDLVAWGVAVLDPSPVMRFALDNNLAWQRQGPLLWHNGGTYGGKACLVVDPERHRLAATLLATHDVAHLDDAAFLACVGRDPMDARPIAVDGRFDQVAVEVCDLLGAHRWADLCAAMTPQCAATLTPEVVAGAWTGLMSARGAYRAATPLRAQRANGAIAVALDLAFSDGVGHAEVSFDDDGRVVGMRIA